MSESLSTENPPGKGRATPGLIAGHRRFVSTSKKLLPLAAGLIVLLILAWPHIHREDNRFRIGFSAIEEREASSPSMVNPRYLGTDDKRQPFSVTADIARNLMQGDNLVELDTPKADLTLEDGTWLVLTAELGTYHREGKSLDLVGSVNLFHDTGYEIRTSRAKIDLAQGAAVGNDAIEGQGPFGEMSAEGFHLIDKGRVILLTGKSRLLLHPSAKGNSP